MKGLCEVDFFFFLNLGLHYKVCQVPKGCYLFTVEYISIIIHLWELSCSCDMVWKVTGVGRRKSEVEAMQVTSLTYIGVWQMWQQIIQFTFQKGLESVIHFIFSLGSYFILCFVYLWWWLLMFIHSMGKAEIVFWILSNKVDFSPKTESIQYIEDLLFLAWLLSSNAIYMYDLDKNSKCIYSFYHISPFRVFQR